MHRRARLAGNTQAPVLLVSLMLLIAAATGSCAKADPYAARFTALKTALAAAAIPADLAASVLEKARAKPEPFFALLAAISRQRKADPQRFARADKEVALDPSYEPADLVSLDGTAISVSRKGHRLRAPAFEALSKMSAAAAAGGVTLLVGSSYRSYAYQKQVFERDVAESGEASASRSTARPGRSQHQLGTAVDFAPISASFAATKAGQWVAARAGAYGFSRSYPEGMESVTGYIPESWHFRYLGTEAVALQDGWFGGVQHYLLKFLQAWPE